MPTPPPEAIPSPSADEADPSAILEFETSGSVAASRAKPRRKLLAAVAAAAIGVLAVALLAGLLIHRRGQLADGMARATALVRLDTAAAYADAAALLAPLADRDPIEAGSLRAFALAMRFLDYRDLAAEAEAERLLVAPLRGDEVPAFAELALAALALGRREAGTATTAATHAAGIAWSDVLHARTALLAGSLDAAAESAAAAAAADPELAPARALEGDAARRAGNGQRARDAYGAALAASPTHPRAAFGLAKLALAGLAPAAEARAAVQRVADDVATPTPERGRAAIHLAALRLRAGDRAGATAALDAAGLDAGARAWAERAAQREAASPHRTLAAVPEALRSPSDDG
jgi:hypothetical protein